MIITYKDSIYELPHQLLNELSLRILDPTAFSPLGGAGCPHKKKKKSEDLRKFGNIRKLSQLHRMIALSAVSSLLAKMKVLLILEIGTSGQN